MVLAAAAAPNSAELFETLRKNWPSLAITGLVMVIMFGMLVYGAIVYFMHLRHNWKTRWLAGIYLGAALPASVIGVALTIMFLMNREPADGENAAIVRPMLVVGMIIGGLLGLAIETGKGLVYTGAGEWLAVKLRQPAFPHLRGWLRERRRRLKGRVFPRTRHFPWHIALLAAAAVVAYTAGLFWLTNPRVSPLIKSILPNLQGTLAPSLGVKLLTAWVVALLAIKEEVVFRLFLQGSFAWWFRRRRGGHLWAVGLSALIWTLAHAGMVEPAWVKYAQILPMGILLGLMRMRWGLESTIMVHVLLNLSAVFALEGFCGQ